MVFSKFATAAARQEFELEVMERREGARGERDGISKFRLPVEERGATTNVERQVAGFAVLGLDLICDPPGERLVVA